MYTIYITYIIILIVCIDLSTKHIIIKYKKKMQILHNYEIMQYSHIYRSLTGLYFAIELHTF